MKSDSLVSICIPTFNRAGMVGKAIESALNQTYADIEVIVVDNASTDNIEEVVSSFKDPRLKFVKNEENLGLFGNFNRCIDLYNGSFLHILHSDDYIDRDFTEKCVRFFEENPDVHLTCTSSRKVSNDGIVENKYSGENVIFRAPEGFRRLLSDRSFIACPSVMVRRGVYENVGKFSLEYPYSSDFLQWLKVSLNFDIAYLSDAWINYRIGEHSDSYRLLFSTPLGYLDTVKIYTGLLEELGDETAEYAHEINLMLRRFIKDCIYAGFMRSDSMDNFRPGIFTGLAMTSWSLIQRESVKNSLIKVSDLLLILFFGFLMHFGFMRSLFRKTIFHNKDLY